MKILHRELEPTRRGTAWLDPFDIGALLSRGTVRTTCDGLGAASAVLTADHLAASSIPFGDHVSLADMAGLAIREFSPFTSAKIGTLRMWMTQCEVNVEFWRPGEFSRHADSKAPFEDETLPPVVDIDRLDRILDYVRTHKAVKAAYPAGVPQCTVLLLCDAGRRTWHYCGPDTGLLLENRPDTQPDAPASAMSR
jgi:hypothetical protein